MRRKPIGRYTYLKELEADAVSPCVVDLFQIEVKALADDFKERGERVLAWVSPDEAARRVRESSNSNRSSYPFDRTVRAQSGK